MESRFYRKPRVLLPTSCRARGWHSDAEHAGLRFNIQGFLQSFVTERCADIRFLMLRHVLGRLAPPKKRERKLQFYPEFFPIPVSKLSLRVSGSIVSSKNTRLSSGKIPGARSGHSIRQISPELRQSSTSCNEPEVHFTIHHVRPFVLASGCFGPNGVPLSSFAISLGSPSRRDKSGHGGNPALSVGAMQ